MREFGADPGDFAVAACPECRRDVLTYPAEGSSAGFEARRCIHCDERLRGALRWIDAADLEALGYVLDAGTDDAGGCASCDNGGCGVKTRGGVKTAR
jgi:hypothetical protein